MNVVMIEPDLIARGHLHFLASVAGLDHIMTAHPLEALARIAPLPQFQADHSQSPVVFITELETPRMSGVHFAEMIRDTLPHATCFALTKGQLRHNSSKPIFDAIFTKPVGAEDVIRATLEIVGTPENKDLFGSMIPGAA